MSCVTLNLTLPDALAEEAKREGLLESQAIETLLRAEIQRRQKLDVWDRIKAMQAAGGAELTPQELQAEISAVRAERRARDASRR